MFNTGVAVISGAVVSVMLMGYSSVVELPQLSVAFTVRGHDIAGSLAQFRS